MNTKELYSKAILGVLEQKAPSCLEDAPDTCAYRGDKGLKCAIGFLITDKIYTDDLENQAICEYEVQEAVEASIERKLTREENNCLGRIQECHDRSASTDDFVSEFIRTLKRDVTNQNLPVEVTEILEEYSSNDIL